MLTVDHYARIRQLRRDGLTIRQIVDQTHHSPKTVLKALAHAEPPLTAPTEPRPAPVFGRFRDVVDGIVDADQTAPRKQRHTATQVFRRLVAEHGYAGSYDQVRRYLQSRRRSRRDTFIPLDHRPGARAEADFGHIYADFPDGRRQLPVLLVTWSYSNAPFALALPTERTEAILHGLVAAFAFFGGVPAELWWDNPKTVAVQLFHGRERTLHPRYAALVSHYALTPKFCLPATATEKPRVENRVYDLQRQWATPVPQVAGFGELNEHLRRCCLAARERTCGGNVETVGERFARDQAAAGPLPAYPFDACVLQPGQVDKFQTVGFDRNRYSVPSRWAFRSVTVKGYVDRVDVVADSDVVARHPRCYGRKEKVLDPLHFLAVLDRKPAALDHAPVYRDWELPPAFAELRQALERRLGARAGARQYIRVLHLLARHPVERVAQAITECGGVPEAAGIITAVERSVNPHHDLTVPAGLAMVSVPTPDLSRFDRLLSHDPSNPQTPDGGDADDGTDRAVGPCQPEAVKVADHAG